MFAKIGGDHFCRYFNSICHASVHFVTEIYLHNSKPPHSVRAVGAIPDSPQLDGVGRQQLLDFRDEALRWRDAIAVAQQKDRFTAVVEAQMQVRNR